MGDNKRPYLLPLVVVVVLLLLRLQGHLRVDHSRVLLYVILSPYLLFRSESRPTSGFYRCLCVFAMTWEQN